MATSISNGTKLIKVCRRTSEDLSVFVVFLIKGLPTTSEDLSVFVLFLLFIIFSFFLIFLYSRISPLFLNQSQ